MSFLGGRGKLSAARPVWRGCLSELAIGKGVRIIGSSKRCLSKRKAWPASVSPRKRFYDIIPTVTFCRILWFLISLSTKESGLGGPLFSCAGARGLLVFLQGSLNRCWHLRDPLSAGCEPEATGPVRPLVTLPTLGLVNFTLAGRTNCLGLGNGIPSGMSLGEKGRGTGPCVRCARGG